MVKTLRRFLSAEHAVVITRIREEIWKDEVMQRIADLEPQKFVKGYWEKHKWDKDIEPYLDVKQEMSVAEGLIFFLMRSLSLIICIRCFSIPVIDLVVKFTIFCPLR